MRHRKEKVPSSVLRRRYCGLVASDAWHGGRWRPGTVQSRGCGARGSFPVCRAVPRAMGADAAEFRGAVADGRPLVGLGTRSLVTPLWQREPTAAGLKEAMWGCGFSEVEAAAAAMWLGPYHTRRSKVVRRPRFFQSLARRSRQLCSAPDSLKSPVKAPQETRDRSVFGGVGARPTRCRG